MYLESVIKGRMYPPELMVAGVRSCHHPESTAGTWLSTSKRPVPIRVAYI